MKPSELFRKQLHLFPTNNEIKDNLIRAVISDEADKTADQIFADHFAPEAPDQDLRGTRTLEQVQALCCHYQSLQSSSLHQLSRP